MPQRRPEPRLYALEAVVDRGFEDVPDEADGAIRRVHAVAPKVPVVVMTGLDDNVVAAQALEEGVLHYFVKSEIATRGLSRPLHYDTFLKRIMKW